MHVSDISVNIVCICENVREWPPIAVAVLFTLVYSNIVTRVMDACGSVSRISV